MAASAQHAFDHGDSACPAEQLELSCIFFKHPSETKSFHCPLAFVVDGRLDGDVCGCCCTRAAVDIQEAFSRGVRRPESQEDIKQSRIRPVHTCVIPGGLGV
jgi:hypothetical protein